MLITLIALTILSVVILAIGFVWVLTSGREIRVWREHRAGSISEPANAGNELQFCPCVNIV